MDQRTDKPAADSEPRLMRDMIHALAIDGLVTGAERAEAAALCERCGDRGQCQEFLASPTLRGVEHAPDFCLNKDRFDALATEVPSTF